MRTLAIARVVALHGLRHQFGPEVAAKKTALLEACSACALTNPRVVLRYHETLLFMAAYPDRPRLARLVDAELARIEAAAPSLFRSGTGTKILKGSGLAGEAIEAGVSIAMIEWLIATWPDDVRLAWSKGTTGTDLDDFLSLSVLAAERDGRLHARFDMQRWLRFAVGPASTPQSELQWVLDRLNALVPDHELRDLIAECADLRVRWKLTPPGPTRTTLRFPARRGFMQRTALKRTVSIKRFIQRPLPDPVRTTPARSKELIDIARGVLIVRRRETDPVTYANPREVTLFTLDRGIDVALFGLEPTRRLPFDSYFGFVAARNRVPIAYGGAWIFDRRAEIGVHLFETFRGGESACTFGQVLRVYHQHFCVSRFQVDPYQFGDDNPEAIRSGAFWFYYRLGFRPRESALQELAKSEWNKVCGDRTYRSPAAVLRRFTKGPLILELNPRPSGFHPDPTRLGVAVTETIRKRFGADRPAARRRTVRRVTRLLPVDRRKRWPADEQFAFERFCPLIAALPDIDEWSAADRRALVAIIRAKGGPRERDFVLRLQRHTALRSSFAALEAAVDWPTLPARPRWRSEDE